MPTSKIPDVVQLYRAELLEDWMRAQLASDTLRSDLLSEAQLRTESDRFLDRLSEALQAGAEVEIHRPEYQPLLELLSDISRSRSKYGFSPTETATFVFSIKQPLVRAVQRAHGSDTAAFLHDVWQTTQLVDKLGLYTIEVYLQSREEIIRRQQEEMLELSTPVVRLWEGIVALPLIGTLDSARTSVVMESLLQSIVETRSEIAIIDITGVPTVDTLVAQHLLKTVAAARLMGADCIISGIRPQIAQTMVHLQIDLSAVTTKATMAEALKTALKRSGYGIARVERITNAR